MAATQTRGSGPFDALHAVYTKRGPAQAARKKALLRTMHEIPLTSASLVSRYHDVLLFLVAFPDDGAIHRIAAAQLRRVARAVRDSRAVPGGLADRLADSGIAHTALEYSFSLPVAAGLSRAYGSDVELAWDDESLGPMLDQFGHLLVPHMEQDGLLTEHYSIRELFELLKGRENQTVLAWLLERFRLLAVPEKPALELYNLLNVPVRWRLDQEPGSRTFTRLARRRLSARSKNPRLKTTLAAYVCKPLPKPVALGRQEAGQFIDVARATLSVRQRETEAVTHPNPDDVAHFVMDGGIDVVLLGMAPEHRLAVESFFGLMATSNGVPIAYGGGFVYRGRLELGLNIFKEYRGGDSSFVYARILRVFCCHFDCRHIVIDSAQFGYGRPGGIASGAFWFYYKLGFRPTEPALAQIAADESARIQREPGYRTPATTLRKFTHSNLALTLAGGSALAAQPQMPDIALAISRHTANRFAGDRTAAAVWAQRRVKRILAVRGMRTWPTGEQQSFLRLSDLVALIHDLADWPASARRSLVSLMRAKGGAREQRYVRLLMRHDRFAHAVAQLATT